mmetsp:Transcript_90893/g.253093  ORF Transcript_90893/g.253093 Transcript_90893/m.253093 type:complete len:275 (+) Transcript_90893:168-992(+)
MPPAAVPARLLELPPQVGDGAQELLWVLGYLLDGPALPFRHLLQPLYHHGVGGVHRDQRPRARHHPVLAGGAVDVHLCPRLVLHAADELPGLPQEAGHPGGGEHAADAVGEIRGARGEGEDVLLEPVQALARPLIQVRHLHGAGGGAGRRAPPRWRRRRHRRPGGPAADHLLPIPARGGRLTEVHQPQEVRELRRGHVALDHLPDLGQASHDGLRNPDDTHEAVAQQGVVVDEDLRPGVAAEPLDVGAACADEEAGHLAGEAKAKDELPRRLAQ